MYSEFDSDFDYLNSETPQQFEQQNQAKAPEITNIERFWMLTGNWGEFGSYFSAGFICIAYRTGNSGSNSGCCDPNSGCWFRVGCIQFGCGRCCKITQSQLILIAVGTALIAGNWDAWQAWIIANSQMLIFSFAVIVITLGFVAAQIWSKLSNVK